MIEIWEKWIEAFDTAFETGDWSKAKEFLTEDVVYIVSGVPFACELRGRDAVISGFRKSLDNFDRKFSSREWEAVNVKNWGDQVITGLAKGRYIMAGHPPITFAANSAWFFRNQKISVMTDIYDVTEHNAVRTLEWLALHGAEIDASYV